MPDSNRSLEPAFPADEVHGDGVQQIKRHLGLTVREDFAKTAMQGILASRVTDEMSFEEIAVRAWAQADAMLAARGES